MFRDTLRRVRRGYYDHSNGTGSPLTGTTLRHFGKGAPFIPTAVRVMAKEQGYKGDWKSKKEMGILETGIQQDSC